MSDTARKPLRRFREYSLAEQAQKIAYLESVLAALLGERLRAVSGLDAQLADHERLSAHARHSLLQDPLLRVWPKCLAEEPPRREG